MTIHPHSHTWIDPEDPPMQRAPYSPVMGPRRREMTPGKEYRCLECGAVIVIKPEAVAG